MARRWHKNFDWTSGEKREFFNFYNKYGDKLSLGFPMDSNSYKKVYFEKDGEIEYITMTKAKGILDAGMQKQVSMYLESVGDFDWALSGMDKPKGLGGSNTQNKNSSTNLTEKLKALRKQFYTARNISAFHVFTDKELNVIADKKPCTLEALSQINGIGPEKLKNYGQKIIGLISRECGSKGEGFCISCGASKSYNVKYPICRPCFKSFDEPYDEYFDHCHKCGEVKRKGRLSIGGYTLCSACWKEEH